MRRRVFWLLPYRPNQSGGPILAGKLANMLNAVPGCRSELILTSEPGELDRAFSEAKRHPAETLFVVTYGPLVPQQIRTIRANSPAAILYFAQSIGWKQHRVSVLSSRLALPGKPDIVCVSRYVASQWNALAPESRVAFIPPLVDSVFSFADGRRDIDVLVHRRKQSDYCLQELVPSLRLRELRVHMIEEWITPQAMADLLRRSKVFLYHTALYVQGGWRFPLGEGFGLPPLEALLCGAHVSCDMLGGVNDFLDQTNATKLIGSVEFDVEATARAVADYRTDERQAMELRERYSEARTQELWTDLLRRWYGYA